MDFKGNLRVGLSRLHCWSNFGKIKNDDYFLNPVGTVASSENENGPCIVIDTMRFANTVSYPPVDDIYKVAINTSSHDQAENYKPNDQEIFELQEVISKDSLASLYDEEKELLWKLR